MNMLHTGSIGKRDTAEGIDNSAYRNLIAAMTATFLSSSATRLAVLVILAVNFAIVVVSTAHMTFLKEMPLPIISGWIHLNEGGAAERLMQLTALLASALLLSCYIIKRIAACLSLCAIYSFIWIDDAFQYHEKAGSKLAAGLNIQPSLGLRAQDIGEMAAWAVAGVFILTPPLFIWLKIPHNRAILSVFAIFLGALAVAGAGFDMLHIIISEPAWVGDVLGILEDGGEVMAVAGGASAALLLRQVLLQHRAHD